MNRLGNMLMGAGLVSADQLQEGLETQVVHGGRLGTNLLELGFLKEMDLARMLGSQYNIPFAAGEMVPDPAALALMKLTFYDEYDLLPMRVDATRLTVAILDPRRIQPLDELSHHVGKRVVPVVVPEFRMNQLLRKHCKAFRPLRPIDMNTLRPSRIAEEAQASMKMQTATDDLINEDEFAKLYAQAATVPGDDEEIIEGVEVGPSPPQQRTVPAPTDSGPLPVSLLPLTFAEAQAEISTSKDREDVARNVLRFAISKFRRALILSVQGDLLTGWHGAGLGVHERAVRRIGVSLRENGSFKLVKETKSHYAGPMKGGKGTAMFYKLLKGGVPKSVVMMPLLVRSKPVHIVYLDQGSNQLTPPDIGELLILAQGVGRAYEAMIRKRQN